MSISTVQVTKTKVTLVRSNLQHTIVPPCQLSAYHKTKLQSSCCHQNFRAKRFQGLLTLRETTPQTQEASPGGGVLCKPTCLSHQVRPAPTVRERSSPGRWGEAAARVRGGRRPSPPTSLISREGTYFSTSPTLHTDTGGGWVRPTWPTPVVRGLRRPSPGPAPPWLPL